MKQLINHLPHYISLIAILIAGLLGMYLFSYDRHFQLGVIIALSLSYISWGIIHHTIHRDICLAIILEYVAISILGSVIVFSLLLRS